MKRGRPDIEVPILFLSTRVSNPSEEDWKKLKRVLGFIKGTINDKRRMGIDDMCNIVTMIDASHAVHENMLSHTGGLVSLGIGILYGKSSKQKLNTKSLTESELVGINDYVLYTIWFKNFIKAQGYTVDKNIIYQDNATAIKMERNGQNSSTGNSRHVSIRYFFVKDRVDKGEIDIKYCPTEKMVADFYIKALQGQLFHRLRRYIMGWDPVKQILCSSSFNGEK